MTQTFPTDLQHARRWVVARLEPVDGRMTKVPYCAFDPSRKASSTNPATWSELETAQRAIDADPSLLLGFVLGDGFVGADWDHCRDAETGAIAPWALDTIAMLDAYTEVSVSGTGVHVICRGSFPVADRYRTGKSGTYPPVPVDSEIEMYDTARYFVMTGHVIRFSELGDRTDALALLHRGLFGISDAAQLVAIGLDPLDRAGKDGIIGRFPALSDDDVLIRAATATNGEKFLMLWRGETSEHGGDHSSADLALCTILGYWTQRDAAQIDRLFRQSNLMRAKWNRHDYRERTIQKAIRS